MKTEFDLLSEVKSYFATATSAQIRSDMEAADFDAFHGIGDPISQADTLTATLKEGIKEAWTQHLMSFLGTAPTVDSLTDGNFQGMSVLSLGKSIEMSALGGTAEGNTEEMPLAA